MNRRTFLASLLALPAAVKAAMSSRGPSAWTVELEPTQHYVIHNFPGAYRGDSTGIHKLLKDCGDVVDQGEAFDMDALFEQVYELKRRREAVDWMSPSGPPPGFAYSQEYLDTLDQIIRR